MNLIPHDTNWSIDWLIVYGVNTKIIVPSSESWKRIIYAVLFTALFLLHFFAHRETISPIPYRGDSGSQNFVENSPEWYQVGKSSERNTAKTVQAAEIDWTSIRSVVKSSSTLYLLTSNTIINNNNISYNNYSNNRSTEQINDVKWNGW